MFAKLLKHEWKSSFKLLSILSACALGMGIFGAVLLRLLFNTIQAGEENELQMLLMIPITLGLFLAYFSILAYSAAVHYLQLYRFYKSRFTDQGYLMFTLPVKTEHHFIAPAINMLIWQFISLVVVFLAIGIVVIFGIDWSLVPHQELDYVYSDFFDTLYFALDTLMIPYLIVSILASVISAVSGVVTSMSCIVIGAVIAKKHKVLAAIGLIYGVSIVTGIITGILSIIPQILLITTPASEEFIMFLSPVLNCIVPIITAVAGYILSINFMRDRLNLP